MDVHERSALRSLARWFSLVRGRGIRPTGIRPVAMAVCPSPPDPGLPLCKANGMETGRLLVKPKLASLTQCMLETQWRQIMHALTHTSYLITDSHLVLVCAIIV